MSIRSFSAAILLGFVRFASDPDVEHTSSLDVGDEDDDDIEAQIAALEARKAKRQGKSIADVGPKAEADKPVAQAPQSIPARGLGKENYVRIYLEDSDAIAPSGQPFGVNGRTYMLKPGVEVDVPPELISVLNDAVMEVPILEPNTDRLIGFRKRLRFPYHKV